MSKQLLKQKLISVSEFLPKWTNFVEMHHTVMNMHQVQDKYGLNIAQFNSCLVGEGHGFNDDYEKFYMTDDGCYFCKRFADGGLKINNVDYKSALNNIQNFYKFKEGLYKHFLRFHKGRLYKGITEYSRGNA